MVTTKSDSMQHTMKEKVAKLATVDTCKELENLSEADSR